MKRLLAAALTLSLAGCSQAQLATTIARAALTPEQVATLTAVCQASAPMLRVASGPAMPAALRETAAFGDAFCSELLRGVLPATADSNSPAWLARILQVVWLATG